MAGSSTQQSIANFVNNYGNLPSWAQPDPSQLKGGGAAGLPAWAQKPAKGPTAFSQPGGGITASQAQAQQKAQATAAKAQAKQNAATQRAADKAARDAQRQADAQAKATAARNTQIAVAAGNLGVGAAGAASSMADTASSIATGISDWASSWPTPGGIGLLLVILFVLLWALIPVDDQGYTRLQLLWFTLMGRTQLQGSQNQQNAMNETALATATSPNLGVSSLGAAAQGTTQDFSISPSLDALNT